MKIKIKHIVLYTLILLLLSGCNSQRNMQTEVKPKDKAPDSLKKLSSGIDELLGTLTNIEKLSLNMPLPQQVEEKFKPKTIDEQTGGQNNQGQGQQNNEQAQDGEGNGNSGQEHQQQQQIIPEPTKDEKLKILWDSMQHKLEEIHPQWNTFEVEGLKKGATKEAGNRFDESFNKMTIAVENKQVEHIYDNASQAIMNLKPFYDLYLDDMGGDISALKYAAYQSYARAIQGNIEGAIDVLNNVEENINKIRLKMTDEDKKPNIEKTSLAISGFKESLSENSRKLFMIKKDIIIENLKSIED